MTRVHKLSQYSHKVKVMWLGWNPHQISFHYIYLYIYIYIYIWCPYIRYYHGKALVIWFVRIDFSSYRLKEFTSLSREFCLDFNGWWYIVCPEVVRITISTHRSINSLAKRMNFDQWIVFSITWPLGIALNPNLNYLV
jgi:hypothetical protein